MSTTEIKIVDVESYPLKSLNSIILRADGGDGGGNDNNNNEDEDEDEGRHSRHIQISTADSKSIRYRDEAELAHFGKRQQLKVSIVSFIFPHPPKFFLTKQHSHILFLLFFFLLPFFSSFSSLPDSLPLSHTHRHTLSLKKKKKQKLNNLLNIWK